MHRLTEKKGLYIRIGAAVLMLLLLFLGRSSLYLTTEDKTLSMRAVAMVFGLFVLLLASLFVFYRKIKLNKVWQKELLLVFMSVASFVILETAAKNNIVHMCYMGVLVNILIFYLVTKVLNMILRRPRLVFGIVSGLAFLIGTLELYVVSFRGNPVFPWDIKAFDTALTVTSSYRFFWSDGTLCAALMLAICFALLYRFDIQTTYRVRNLVISAVCAAGGIVLFCTAIYPKLDQTFWDVKSVYESQGFVASFLSYIRFMKYEEPDGYSAKEAKKLLENEQPVKSEQTKAKNIIVVMNESFSDLRMINDEMIDDSYMPFLDSLKENTIRANLCVPVFGGQTCNTEFEVLTGVSTRYSNSTPYMTSVNHNINSLVDKLEEEGYESFAFHPNTIKNWNREKVYNYFGFNSLLDIEDVKSPSFVRWCVDDKSDYDKVIETYENNKDRPFFMFNVTMQNHGGYAEEYENFKDKADLSKYGNFPQAETYLALMQESDRALKKLISYFEKVDEPTMICFFGDHQASLDAGFYDKLFGKATGSLTPQENMKMYMTPMVIWANYELKEQQQPKISANYLEDLILLSAGCDLEGYEAFTYHLYEKYPVVSVHGILNSEGTFCDDKNVDELLKKYEWVQYYRMKDETK